MLTICTYYALEVCYYALIYGNYAQWNFLWFIRICNWNAHNDAGIMLDALLYLLCLKLCRHKICKPIVSSVPLPVVVSASLSKLCIIQDKTTIQNLHVYERSALRYYKFLWSSNYTALNQEATFYCWLWCQVGDTSRWHFITVKLTLLGIQLFGWCWIFELSS